MSGRAQSRLNKIATFKNHLSTAFKITHAYRPKEAIQNMTLDFSHSFEMTNQSMTARNKIHCLFHIPNDSNVISKELATEKSIAIVLL